MELSAENGQSIHAVIAQFSRQHSADAGSPVEVTVQEAGRSRQLTVAPDGKVAQSLPTGPIPAPADTPQTRPDPHVDEPVTMAVTPLGDSPPAGGVDTHARPVPAARTPTSTSVLAAPEITAGFHEPARAGLRGRLNTLLNLRIAPKPESAEMRHRAAIASITGPLPGFSIVTIANPKGGVGKTPLAVGLNAIIAEHRGAATTVCVDVADVGGSLADRVSIPPRDGHDVLALIAAETAAPGSIRPSALSQYLTRQPGGTTSSPETTAPTDPVSDTTTPTRRHRSCRNTARSSSPTPATTASPAAGTGQPPTRTSSSYRSRSAATPPQPRTACSSTSPPARR
ncbi:hypothetical protein ACQGAO_30745 [Rhodococcus sp. 1.20]